MTPNEQIAAAAAASQARLQEADEEALLAAEAFTYGAFDKYVEAKIADINRRIDERFGTANRIPWLADPDSLKPA